MSKRGAPIEPDLTEIHAWRDRFVAAHDQYLRDNPDTPQNEATRRAQVKAIADTRVAEVREALLARQAGR